MKSCSRFLFGIGLFLLFVFWALMAAKNLFGESAEIYDIYNLLFSIALMLAGIGIKFLKKE